MLDKEEPYSKAACAKLRRAVGKSPGETPDVWEITLYGAPDDEKSDKAIHTGLTLYALHRQGKNESMSEEKVGFGTAIAKLVALKPENEDAIKAIRRRFNAVATSVDFTELAYHAKGLVQLLKSNDIKMDYPRFASELFYFQFPEQVNRIRLEWGKQFYHIVESENNKKERTDEK
jgi:CRISPR system Cascade subunit CasB